MLDDVLIAPSLFAANQLRIEDELQAISSADFIHFDVMDGVFVPNLSFGPQLLRQIKQHTDKPVDCHLMICEPDRRALAYAEAGADIVVIHYEAQTHAHRTLDAIRAAGAQAGLAINPGTPVCVLESLIEQVDLVLVMSVNPGYSGQAFIEASIDKVHALHEMCERHGVSPTIEVDGGVGEANAAALVAAGANMLVAGSAIFSAKDSAAALDALRACAREGLSARAKQ